MKCGICGRRRQTQTLSRLLVSVSITVNYQTGTRITAAAGTLICDTERRSLTFDGTSDGMRLHWTEGRIHREDGRDVIEPAYLTPLDAPRS